MKKHFDALPESARAAWTELWTFLDDLSWDDADGNSITRPFSASTLRRALEGLGRDLDRQWRGLRRMLRGLGPMSSVRVRRVMFGMTSHVYPSTDDKTLLS